MNSSDQLDTLDSIILNIFSNPIQRPCTYNIEFEAPTNSTYQQQTQYIFKQLTQILEKGCKILFPNAHENGELLVSRLTAQNFARIKQYFESFGFRIKNRISANPSYNDAELIDEGFIDSYVNWDLDIDNFELPSLPNNDNISDSDVNKKELRDYIYRLQDNSRNVTYEISFEMIRA
jgi:hypothetical protein